mmetsp:Transcript_28782/g.63656  ORF Transcript_28782/g.63656 Transcript_28782/m.63656 type:complete len:299 (+) Transcript_28782:1115-2011(+)
MTVVTGMPLCVHSPQQKASTQVVPFPLSTTTNPLGESSATTQSCQDEQSQAQTMSNHIGPCQVRTATNLRVSTLSRIKRSQDAGCSEWTQQNPRDSYPLSPPSCQHEQNSATRARSQESKSPIQRPLIPAEQNCAKRVMLLQLRNPRPTKRMLLLHNYAMRLKSPKSYTPTLTVTLQGEPCQRQKAMSLLVLSTAATMRNQCEQCLAEKAMSQFGSYRKELPSYPCEHSFVAIERHPFAQSSTQTQRMPNARNCEQTRKNQDEHSQVWRMLNPLCPASTPKTTSPCEQLFGQTKRRPK